MHPASACTQPPLSLSRSLSLALSNEKNRCIVYNVRGVHGIMASSNHGFIHCLLWCDGGWRTAQMSMAMHQVHAVVCAVIHEWFFFLLLLLGASSVCLGYERIKNGLLVITMMARAITTKLTTDKRDFWTSTTTSSSSSSGANKTPRATIMLIMLFIIIIQ